MRICQLINPVLALFLVSCSTPKVEDKQEEHLIEANWLKVPLRFAHRDKDDNVLTHPFFDVDPSFKKDKRTINYFVTTPEESAYKYNLDLYSGRLYKEHNYCPVDDVWDFYKGDLERPNFTEGIVPRLYDQNGNPQRIIIFSHRDAHPKFKYLPTGYDTAKIVGSLITESCEGYPCDSKNKWKGTQILLGVSPRDDRFTKVNLLNELKSSVDWNYVKSFLANQDGVHQVGKRYYPAVRISRELNLDDTFRYFEKYSVPVKMDELVKWREGCFKLYDDFWEKSEKIRGQKSGQQESFLKLFREFYAKDSGQYYACQKLVRPANINDDVRRLWFYAYIQAFFNLEKNGFYYSCSDKSWSYNPKVDDERYFNSQARELERCRARDLEKSFEQAINALSLMKNQINKEFRFVEYDSERGGSHQKIYAWIAENTKAHACKYKKEAIKENQFDFFPQDVGWEPFASSEEDRTIK
ncbi:MAG: hypothetical protein ACXVLQ_14285 [Bacteriovorax sp.]